MAAIRHAGGALLRRMIPAGSLWGAAVAGKRPALRSLQQYPLGLHRPAAARAAFSTASTQVDISSSEPNGCSKESEEDKKKRRRMAAMMLMKSHCTDDRESEMKSIDELFALLDPANDYSYGELTELQDRRSLFEQKKNALLIALLGGDAEQEKEKMAELVDAGRLLRDAVSGRYQLHGQRKDAPKLEEDVAEIKRDLKKMMEGQGKSVSAEPAAADDSTRALLARVLADNTTIQEILDTLKVSVADNKAMLERFGEEQKDLKESVDTLDSTVDKLDDSVREGMRDLGEHIGTDEDSLKEAIEETVKEAIEGVEDKVKETIEETVKDAMEEAVKEILEDTVKEIVEESVREAMEETVKDVIEETLKEVMEETVKDIMEESVKETLQETVKETMEERMKEVMEETVKDVMEETLKEVMEETMKDIMEEAVKETIQETVKETMEETVKEIMEETVKDFVEETVKDAMESVETSLERVEESLGKLEDRA